MDLELDELYLKKVDITVPMMETPGGHYEVDLLDRGDSLHAKPAFPNSVRIADAYMVKAESESSNLASFP